MNRLEWKFVPADSNTAPLSLAGPYMISHRWNIVPTIEEPNRKVWYFPLSYWPGTGYQNIDNFDTLEEAKTAAQTHADEQRN